MATKYLKVKNFPLLVDTLTSAGTSNDVILGIPHSACNFLFQYNPTGGNATIQIQTTLDGVNWVNFSTPDTTTGAAPMIKAITTPFGGYRIRFVVTGFTATKLEIWMCA